MKYRNVYTAPTDPQEYQQWLKVAKERAKEVLKDEYEKMRAEMATLKRISNVLSIPAVAIIGFTLFLIFELLFQLDAYNVKIEKLDFYSETVVVNDTVSIPATHLPLRVLHKVDEIQVEVTKNLGIYKSLRIDGFSSVVMTNSILRDAYYGLAGASFFSLIASVCLIFYRNRSTPTLIAMFGISVFALLLASLMAL